MYKKLYFSMFNAVTDAIKVLESDDLQKAREILICAQQRAEEEYLNKTEPVKKRDSSPVSE